MALMDEFREERENIKNGTWQQKLSYFWEYYKWYVIIPAIIIFSLVWYIHHMITKTDDILHGLLINAHTMEAQTSADELATEFIEKMKIDTKEYSITFNTSVTYIADDTSGTANYETTQALMAWIAAGTIDFMSGDIDAMTDLAYKQYTVDLRDVLSKDELAKYEPYFLYIDQAVIDARSKAFENNEDGSDIVIPDCTKPETMEKPIPVMIDISKCDALSEIYGETDDLALGIANNAPNVETLMDFLEYITE